MLSASFLTTAESQHRRWRGVQSGEYHGLAGLASSGISRFVNPGDDPNLGDLKNAIQANQLVAIMGTGVSLAVAEPLEVDGFKVASWQGLIQHGIHRCRSLSLITEERAEQLKKLVGWDNVDDLIYVAESVTKTLRTSSAGTYQKWLNDTVGKLTVKAPRLIHALDRIRTSSRGSTGRAAERRLQPPVSRQNARAIVSISARGSR